MTLDELSDGRLTNVQQQLTSGNEANDGNRRNSIFSQQFETLRASGNEKRCRSRSSIRVVTASGKRNASRDRFSEKLPLRLQFRSQSIKVLIYGDQNHRAVSRGRSRDKCTRLDSDAIGVDKASIIDGRYPQSDIYRRRSLMRRNVKLITTLAAQQKRESPGYK